MKDRLLPLSKLAVKAEQPLLYPVLNRHGTLLAEKGLSLTESQVNKIMELNAIYTHEAPLLTALIKESKQEEIENNAIFRTAPPFSRIASLENILHKIFVLPENRINQSKILTIINRLQMICEKSPDAAIAKIITDDNSNYTIKHSIHTAILCELSGQYLNWPAEKRRNIAGAALTMNLSLGYLQDKLLDQSSPLSTIQQRIINAHPKDSVELLKKMGVSNSKWLELVEKHHESVDGSGYPSGLTRKNIPMEASLVSLADIYCAKVTGRNYREPIFANIAVRDIFLDKDNQGTLIEVFVKLLGLYPPGCIVKLQSGETGLVTKRGVKVGTPKVLLLNNLKNGVPMNKILRDTNQKDYAIKSIVESKKELENLDFDGIWIN